jgi:hypothetical protein
MLSRVMLSYSFFKNVRDVKFLVMSTYSYSFKSEKQVIPTYLLTYMIELFVMSGGDVMHGSYALFHSLSKKVTVCKQKPK